MSRGLILGALECLLVLSLSGKLVYDRATLPRVWVKTAPWNPSLPIRGRYLALRLAPERSDGRYAAMNGALVLFFVPEHALPFESARATAGTELWAEVTIPRKGPPRPIRLAINRAGQMEILKIN